MTNSSSQVVHGVLMSVFGSGVLLTGHSGAGKSDLALSLITRGHSFVADDAIEFVVQEKTSLLGRPAELLKNLLEIRGLGVLDIPALFGAQAVLNEQALALVVKLEQPAVIPHNLSFESQPWSLLGVTVPCFTLPLTAQRPREVLLEALVRNYQLIQTGKQTNMAFIEKQRRTLGGAA